VIELDANSLRIRVIIEANKPILHGMIDQLNTTLHTIPGLNDEDRLLLMVRTALSLALSTCQATGMTLTEFADMLRSFAGNRIEV